VGRGKIEEFLSELKAIGRSVHTILTYQKQLQYFQDWLGRKPIEQASEEDLRRYLAHLRDEGKEDQTIRLAYASVRRYFEFLGKSKLSMKTPVVHLKSMDWLTPSEVDKMVEVAKNLRDKCLIAVLWASAIRRKEVRSLNWRDIDFMKSRGYVVAKGMRKEEKRFFPLDARAIGLLQQLKAQRDPKNPAVFTGAGGKGRISYWTIFKIIKRLAKEAGIKKRVSVHTLRHSACSYWGFKKLPDSVRMELGRWKTPEMVKHYSHHTENELMRLYATSVIEEARCPRCTKALPKGALYCAYCGTKLPS